MEISESVKNRLLNYVKFDTQSDYTSKTVPSTSKQLILLKELVKELHNLNISNTELDDFGYVYATIPSNSSKNVPIICFCSHIDTSPDCSGEGVKPIVHANYNGSDLLLPEDNIIIRFKDHPDLAKQIGNDIITASGNTLLGADNKAGVAEIMTFAEYLMTHEDVKHGEIKILFTPDEEIGRGVDHVNMVKLGADFGYTIDGETLGSFEDETFSADGMTLTISGVSAHPGFAKGKMQSAIKVAAEIISALPKNRLTPESTDEKEGFVHPVNITGTVEEAQINLIIRDFEDEMILQHEEEVKLIASKVLQNYPECKIEFKITEQYRNMKKIIAQHPKVSEYALRAIERAGITPIKRSIRGGTDGSRLSFMGLPCPNLFAGEHAFHSKEEWVSVQDMEAAVKTMINLAIIWEEESE